MGTINNKPCCDGRENCQTPITSKPITRTSRKLTPNELKKINNNQKIERY